MTLKYNIEEVPDRKEKKKLLDSIKALIPEPIPWKNALPPTKEELIAIIQPLIPEPIKPKEVSKKSLLKMIDDKISEIKLNPETEFDVKETAQWTEITVNGKKHLIPQAVYWPKLRNFNQLGDVPWTYVGKNWKSLRVNTTETGLEYYTPTDTAAVWWQITGTLSNQTDLQTALDAKAPGGSDTQLQYNNAWAFGWLADSVATSTGLLGLGGVPTVREHIFAKGQTVDTPASLTVTRTLDTAIDSPWSASATQIDSPIALSTPTVSFIEIDYCNAGSTSGNYGSGNYTANGQTIYYRISSFKNPSSSLPITNPTYYYTSFTDAGTPWDFFSVDITGLNTSGSSNYDGFIIEKSYDNSNWYYSATTVSTSFNDDDFTTTTPFEISQYAESGATWNAYIAQYSTIPWITSLRNDVYTSGSNTDSNFAGLYLILDVNSWWSLTNDWFIVQHHNGYYYNIGTNSSYLDWWQTTGNVGDYSTFSVYAFPFFNTSITQASWTSAQIDYGSGNLTADNSNWDLYLWDYRTNTVGWVKYYVGSPVYYGSSLTDNNSLDPMSFSGSITPWDWSGCVVEVRQNGTSVGYMDIGSSSSFSGLDGTNGAWTAPTNISSYTWLVHNFSAYGYISSPVTKYSTTHNDYTLTDNNPVGWYLIYHQWATFWNATGIKALETAPRSSGYFYWNNNTASNYQYFTALGDNTVTPAKIGFLATGQTLSYRSYATKTYNGTVVWSSGYASGSTLFPNDWLYYVVDLTSATVSGATYKFQKVGVGYQTDSDWVYQDTTVSAWNSSSTLTPTTAPATAFIAENNAQLKTDPAQMILKTNATGWGVYNSMALSMVGSDDVERARIGFDWQGWVMNYLSSSNIHDFYGKTVGIEARISPSETFFNRNYQSSHTFTVEWQGYVKPLILASAADKTVIINWDRSVPSNTSFAIYDKDSISTALRFIGTGTGDYLYATGKSGSTAFRIDYQGKTVIGSTSSPTGMLSLYGQGTSYPALMLNAWSLTSSPVTNALENDWTNLYVTSSGGTRRIIPRLGQSGALTTNNIPYANSSGQLIDSGIALSGGLLTVPSSVQVLFAGGISISSGKDISMGSYSRIIGGFGTNMPAVTASATLSQANHSPQVVITGTTAWQTLTLPTAASVRGMWYWIKNQSTQNWTIACNGAQTIYRTAATTTVILKPGETLTVVSDNTNWVATNYDDYALTNTWTGLQTYTGWVTITTADLTLTDRDMVLGTTTGTKFGTATTQKQSFWNATPIVQPANTVAIDTLLVNTGLRATGGVALFDTDVKMSTAGKGLFVKEGTNGMMWQVALVAGTKAITINGIGTGSRAFVQLVTPNTTALTTSYQAVCTANTLTIQANVAAWTINVADISTLNYFVIQQS